MTELDKRQSEDPTPVGEPDDVDAEGSLQGVVLQRHFSGPVPHPEVLNQYNAVLPNGAERIVKLTEDQSAHRRKMETRGQLFAFIIAMTALAGGIVLIALGDSVEGLVPLLAAIGGLVGLFIYREVSERRAVQAMLDQDD